MAKTTCINYALDLMNERGYARVNDLYSKYKSNSFKKHRNIINRLVFYKWYGPRNNEGNEIYLFENEQNLIDFVNTNFLEDEE